MPGLQHNCAMRISKKVPTVSLLFLENLLLPRNSNNISAVVTGFGHTEERRLFDSQRTQPSEYLKQAHVYVQENQRYVKIDVDFYRFHSTA